jgi:hypothetical protein
VVPRPVVGQELFREFPGLFQRSDALAVLDEKQPEVPEGFLSCGREFAGGGDNPRLEVLGRQAAFEEAAKHRQPFCS